MYSSMPGRVNAFGIKLKHYVLFGLLLKWLVLIDVDIGVVMIDGGFGG